MERRNEQTIDFETGKRVVVMTGGTAGLGAHALNYLATQSDMKMIVGARGSGRTVPSGVEVLPLDLASLASVRAFAEMVKRWLGTIRIDMLILNAGMQYGNNERKSEDGYELTFAVNHLAHYLLVRLLLPCMADYGRVVITTSDTHDPAIAPIAPKELALQELAHPTKTGFGTGIRAYAASKLCNLMTAQYLSKLKEVADHHLTIIAFNPGFTGGTSLGRDSSPFSRMIVTVLIHTVFRLVGLFRPEYVMGKPDRAGKALAEIAMGDITPPEGRMYVSLVRSKATWPDPSALAQDGDAQEMLWRESEWMVGIKKEV
ncbi:SDR family NAD(P)-dependent oxidoreductase [Chitinophaga sp.]|uniref:SDR family NAD(P)-dependent oxidoreductase n=1 Tax=Chitinophaga sp. TaxID=1869181 RepID=UPI0031D4617B